MPGQPHHRLFFPDGDVILVVPAASPSAPPDTQEAGPAQLYTLFRVHKFLLSHHSSVFSNLFRDGNAEASETYEGVPIVRLDGDRAEDFELLLVYFYYPSELTLPRLDPKKPIVFTGVIRLADKYMIEGLREHLIDQVIADWPRTLDEWLTRAEEISATQRSIRDGTVSGRICDKFPEPVTAINFAREFGCASILPAAFYYLSTIPPEFRWNEFDYDTGAKWTLLQQADWLRYSQGCHRIWNSINALAEEIEDLTSHECEIGFHKPNNENSCFRYTSAFVSLALEDQILPMDPFKIFDIILRRDRSSPQLREQFPSGLCKACEVYFIASIQDRRRGMWDRLDEIFHLC